ncbi:MAG: hypothetical protein GY714_12700, partial [Desulfobacterales bacterium]|nr:hypothetical protein [Desulfobacterales bacterium]
EFLKYWDMVTALVAIYSIGQLVGSIPGIFKNLRGKYTALRGKAIKNLDDAEVKSFEDSIENFLKKGEDAVEEAKAVGVKGSKGKVPAATKAAAKPGKIEIDDYVKTGHFTPKDEVTILNKYNQEYNKDIDIIVKQLKSRKGTARSTEEMALLIKNSAKPPKVIGRVSLKDYPGFAPHDVAWVLDPAELKGLSNTDIMRRCGWEDSYIKNILDLKPDKRPSIVINLIENPGKLKVPTWDFFQQKTKNMIDAQDKYLINNIKRVKGLDIDKIDTYFDILKKTSVEDVDKLPAHIQDFRKILELKFGNNTLFSGRGFTVTPAGKFGLREWLMAKPDVSFDLGKMKQDGFTIKQIKLGWE